MPRTYTPPQPFETTPRPPIQLVAVKSRQVASVGYDVASATLAMQFHGKPGDFPGPRPVYHYPDVTVAEHAALMGRGVEPEKHSIGKHFGAHIKGKPFKKYPSEPVPAAASE